MVIAPPCDTGIRTPARPLSRPAPSPAPTAFTGLLERRRSIRRLRDGPLPPGALDRIAAAASLVPAAFNAPGWHVAIVRDRREAFWDTVERAFQAGLDGDRLDRYLARLDGFRRGSGAVLVFEDRTAPASLAEAYGLPDGTAEAYGQQAIGMVQLAVWLAIVDEGLATSLQHWEDLIEEAAIRFLDLPPGRFRLTATMPVGYPDEAPRAVERPPVGAVVSVDRYAGGGETHLQP